MSSPINATALRRAMRYLEDQGSSCNEVKTLRALVEQAQLAEAVTAHDKAKPQWPAADAASDEFEKFQRETYAWRANHPGGPSFTGTDHLKVTAVPLVADTADHEPMKPGLYAIRRYSSWADGDVCEALATYNEKSDGIWRYHESGAPVLEYEGDKILQAWPLTDTPNPELTYSAGLEAAAMFIWKAIDDYKEKHGTRDNEGKLELSDEGKRYTGGLYILSESIRQLASADPVPSAHVINLLAE